jgi:hypothetical protein
MEFLGGWRSHYEQPTKDTERVQATIECTDEENGSVQSSIQLYWKKEEVNSVLVERRNSAPVRWPDNVIARLLSYY